MSRFDQPSQISIPLGKTETKEGGDPEYSSVAALLRRVPVFVPLLRRQEGRCRKYRSLDRQRRELETDSDEPHSLFFAT